jgi:hypothetical protein
VWVWIAPDSEQPRRSRSTAELNLTYDATIAELLLSSAGGALDALIARPDQALWAQPVRSTDTVWNVSSGGYQIRM